MLTITDLEEMQAYPNTWGQKVAVFVMLFFVLLVLGGHSEQIASRKYLLIFQSQSVKGCVFCNNLLGVNTI